MRMRLRACCCIVTIAALAHLVASIEASSKRPSEDLELPPEEDGLIHLRNEYGPALQLSSTVLQLKEPTLEIAYKVQYLTERNNNQGQSNGREAPVDHKLQVNGNIDTKVLKSYG